MGRGARALGILILAAVLPSVRAAQAGCVDKPNFQDYNNFGCTTYTDLNWCDGSSAPYGPGWNTSWGSFYDYANSYGMTAITSCCVCANQIGARDCVLADWTSWSACTTSLAGCLETRSRAVVTLGAHGGTPCGTTEDSRVCYTCQLCEVGPWGSWSTCDSQYGYRTRERTRTSNFSTGALCLNLGEVDTTTCSADVTLPPAVLNTTGLNSNGQLGIGNLVSQTTPVPVILANSISVTDAAFGLEFSLYLAGGLLYAMGANSYGELGTGDDVERNTSQYIPSPDGAPIVAIAAGGGHSAFITDLGNVYLVGLNIFGQLGSGNASWGRYLYGLLESPGGPVAQVALGALHSALLLANGSLYTFGYNSNGQLGLNDTTDRFAPQWVPLAAAVATVNLGYFHSAVITTGGALYLFGANTNGELGIGNTIQQNAPVRLRLPRGAIPSTAALGYDHTLVVTTGHLLYAFGSNAYGQLGLGSLGSDMLTPQLVPFGAPIVVANASLDYSCFSTTTGAVYIFGLNDKGQLGLNDTASRPSPTLLSIPSADVLIGFTIGGSHSGIITQAIIPEPTPTPTSTPTTVIVRCSDYPIGVPVPIGAALPTPPPPKGPNPPPTGSVRFFR